MARRGRSRPRNLAIPFYAYFLAIFVAAWLHSSTLTGAWYLADVTRWVYTTYMLAAAALLAGLGGGAVLVTRAQEAPSRPRGSAGRNPSGDLPPPLEESQEMSDRVDRDIDQLLTSLTEIEASTAREAQRLEAAAEAAGPETVGESSASAAGTEAFRGRSAAAYLGGPAAIATIILGISGAMLPAAGGFLQSNHQLNTTLILWMSYSWAGLGGYTMAAFGTLVSRRRGRRK